MHWKFEPIFSIQVQHQRTLNGVPSSLPDFEVMPAAATAERMRRLNWIFKTQPDGARVFAEQVIAPDGQASFARSPLDGEAFTFLIRLNNTSLLNNTAPYMKSGAAASRVLPAGPVNMRSRAMAIEEQGKETAIPNTALPSFSGRSRLLYLDNLSTVAIPQPNAPPLLRLTAGEFVDIPEFASRGPTTFTLSPKAGSKQVEFTPLTPDKSPVMLFDVAEGASRVNIDLPANGYRLRQIPGNHTEVMYLGDEQIDSSTLGVIRIFQWPDLPILDTYRRYSVQFAEVR